jgi:hypothetical protein
MARRAVARLESALGKCSQKEKGRQPVLVSASKGHAMEDATMCDLGWMLLPCWQHALM